MKQAHGPNQKRSKKKRKKKKKKRKQFRLLSKTGKQFLKPFYLFLFSLFMLSGLS
jgi:hypothetical protein